MRERGFIIIGTAVVMALAVALGFGATVILKQSNLITSARRAQEKLSLKSHEFISIQVWRNSDNTEVLARNTGSVDSIIKTVVVEETDNSLIVYDLTPVAVGVLDNSTFVLENHVNENATLGVLTRLGNVFWED